MIVCPKCGKELADGTKFCSKCGEKIVAASQEVPAGMIQCPKCGKQVKAGTKFCMGCGEALSDVTTNVQEKKPEVAVAQEAPKAEEVKKEEPKAEAPKAEAPKAQEVKPEVQKQEENKTEPAKRVETKQETVKTEEPKKEEAKAGAPKAEEPKKEETKAEDAKKEEPQKENPQKEEPKKQNLFANPMVKYGCIAAAVILVLVLLGCLMGGGSGSGKHAFMYLKDKEFMYSELKQKSSWQASVKLVKDGGYENSELRRNMAMYYCTITEDGKQLFFPDKMERGDDGVTLYTRPVNNQKKEPMKIDSSIVNDYITSNGAYVTYKKSTDDLYQFNVKKEEKTKIDNEVADFRTSKDGSKVYYRKTSGELYVWTQSKKEKEKIDSDTSKFYVSSDYKTIFYVREGSLYKKVGTKDKEKVSSDIKRVFQVYDSGEAYFSKSESDYEEIWYYDGKETEKLTDRMTGYPATGYESPVIAYLSTDEDDPKEKIFNVAVKKNITTLEVEDASGYNAKVDIEGKYLYFFANQDDKNDVGDLYKVTISGGKASSKAEKYESEVYLHYLGLTENDQVIYFKEVANDKGDLYCDKKKIDSDVSEDEFVYCNETKEIVYLADYDTNKERGTLKIANSKTGKSKKIADDIYGNCYTLVPGGSVLYLNDYSTKYYKGDLYLYKGGKSIKIDEDVTMIVCVR